MKQLTSENGVTLLAETPGENIQALRVYREGSQIIIRIDLGARYKGMIDEVLQYLEPAEAIVWARAIISCASS